MLLTLSQWLAGDSWLIYDEREGGREEVREEEREEI